MPTCCMSVAPVCLLAPEPATCRALKPPMRSMALLELCWPWLELCWPWLLEVCCEEALYDCCCWDMLDWRRLGRRGSG